MAEVPLDRVSFERAKVYIDGSREAEALATFDAACLKDGVLQVMPAAYYAAANRNDLSVWCVRRGLYCLPTVELIDWLREQIDGSAIEIAAGHGAIGRALGIPITDSREHENPGMAARYAEMQQGLTICPPDVEKLTAAQAVEKYRPSVIIGAWATWRYDERRHWAGGSQYGVDHEKLLAKPFVQRFVHIGHERVHAPMPLRMKPHREHRLPFLWARPLDPLNVIWTWEK